MAHFVRPLALADSLDTSRYDVHFYAPARFFRYLQGKPFTIGELHSMPGERFLENTVQRRLLSFRRMSSEATSGRTVS